MNSTSTRQSPKRRAVERSQLWTAVLTNSLPSGLKASLAASFGSSVAEPTFHLLLSAFLGTQPVRSLPLNSEASSARIETATTRTRQEKNQRFMIGTPTWVLAAGMAITR